MREQVLFVIVFAILCLEYLFGLSRRDEDRTEGDLEIVEPQGSTLFNGAVMHKPIGPPECQIEVDAVYSELKGGLQLVPFYQARNEYAATTSACS